MTWIAVTGGDGAGKSSVIAHLARRLRQLDMSVHVVDKWDVLDARLHPELAGRLGDRETLRGLVERMNPLARRLFVIWMISAPLDRAATSGCEVTLLDGFWMKHAAAEVVRGASEAWIESLVAEFPRPDATFVIDTPVEVTARRKLGAQSLYECGVSAGAETSDTAFRGHQERLRAVLLGWAQRRGWIVVPGTGSVEEIAGALLEHCFPASVTPRTAPSRAGGVEIQTIETRRCP